MASPIEALRLDVEELKKLEQIAVRQKVKDILSIEIKRLETVLSNKILEESKRNDLSKSAAEGDKANRCYNVKLNNYAWDQSDKFVKVFVSVNNVHTISADKVKCSFTESSFELVVSELQDRNYLFSILNLLEKIDPEKSSWKIKPNEVVVMLRKTKEGRNWSHMTEAEKKAKEASKPPVPKVDDDDLKDDPSKGLMSLMKKMYDDGDDEMKRTIAKAWTESRDKQGAGGFGGMPSF